MTYDHILLNYCGKDELRPAMMEPKTIGDYTWATDGHRALRVPNHLLEKTYPGYQAKPYPNIEAVVNPYFERLREEPLLLDKEALRRFFDESSTDREYENCGRCGGIGEITCPVCDHNHDCKECDGTGNGRPTGKKLMPWRTHVIFGNQVFQADYIQALLDSAGEEPVSLVGGRERKEAGLFQFGEVFLVIMPKFVEGHDEGELVFRHPVAQKQAA